MIKDPENYFEVQVVPMDHTTKVVSGERRELWLNKKYVKKLFDLIDELHTKQCLDRGIHT